MGAAAASVVVFGAFILWLPVAPSEDAWVTKPLGLSLRVTLQHPSGTAPTADTRRTLHRLGEQARRDIKGCIAGVSGAPKQVTLVFDEGVVTLASGPVSTRSDHGACVAQTLEGLWGEVDGRWSLRLNLSLD